MKGSIFEEQRCRTSLDDAVGSDVEGIKIIIHVLYLGNLLCQGFYVKSGLSVRVKSEGAGAAEKPKTEEFRARIMRKVYLKLFSAKQILFPLSIICYVCFCKKMAKASL